MQRTRTCCILGWGGVTIIVRQGYNGDRLSVDGTVPWCLFGQRDCGHTTLTHRPEVEGGKVTCTPYTHSGSTRSDYFIMYLDGTCCVRDHKQSTECP